MVGGATLHIYGLDFEEEIITTRVYIGTLPCLINPLISHSQLIVCTLPPQRVPGAYPVRVIINNKNYFPSSTWRNIDYEGDYTPYIKSVDQNAGNPGEETVFYSMSRSTFSGHIDKMTIGDSICTYDDIRVEDEDSSYIRSGWTGHSCETSDLLEAGYYNVSMTTVYGLAKKLSSNLYYNPNDKAIYEYAVIPKIESVSASSGSANGQIITISGKGFSSKAG
jgi:hypothetical protein